MKAVGNYMVHLGQTPFLMSEAVCECEGNWALTTALNPVRRRDFIGKIWWWPPAAEKGRVGV